MGADRIGGDRHAFQHAVRIAFQNGTVHECSRIAFIGIADDVLLIARRIRAELPLHAGREAGAASASQPGLLHLINDFLRLHGRQDLAQRLIAVDSDVFIDVFRIDLAAVSQRDALLFFIELDLVDIQDLLFGDHVFFRQFQARDNTSLVQMLGDDLLDIFRLDMAVEDLVRINGDDRTFLAESEAAGLDDFDFILKTEFLQRLAEFFIDQSRVVRGAPGAGADQYIYAFYTHLVRPP